MPRQREAPSGRASTAPSSCRKVRLLKLKLAGFKTFVDPTTVHTPGNLVGVVGPNGCGKSNVIDAVRWVLGETRASALRGESMQDVIFNGSTTRKPVSRASVELVFDNAEGRAAGQWSQYAEISVKRVLDRSGESTYYINSVRVRRKDVVDLFLGTGLGPRAYAIIEQGMISRIIEARPEEIRGFLEEAAGVTKYRERRRETEGRLRDARDNLLRLDDIRMELGERIEHLAAQAEIARKYRELSERHAERQGLLWLLKRDSAQAQQRQIAEQVAETGRQMEADSARLQQLEQLVEEGRTAHLACSEAVNAAQTDLYAISSEVSRLEAERQRLNDHRERINARLGELATDAEHWRSRDAQLADEGARWRELLGNARERVAEAKARYEQATEQLPELEEHARAAAVTTQTVRRELAQTEQQARVQEAHRGSAARALEALAERRSRLSDVPETAAPDELEIARAEAQQQALEGELKRLEGELGEVQAAVPQLQETLRAATGAERAAQATVTERAARCEALRQLQAKVRDQGELGSWLKRHGLDALQPLWQRVQVEPGWERAVEAVLRERLSALSLADAAQLEPLIADPAPANLALICPSPSLSAAPAMPTGCQPLRALVQATDAAAEAVLDHWLADVAVSDDPAVLAAPSPEHGNGVRLVGRDGQLRDAVGLTQYAPDARTDGVIERQREIETIEQALLACREAASQAAEATRQADARLVAAQEHGTELRRQLQASQQQLHAGQVGLLKLTQARQRAQEHAERVARDIDELNQAELRERERLEVAERELARAGEMTELQGARLDAALSAQGDRDEQLHMARAQEQSLARELQELRFTERECEGKLEDNARNAELAEEQGRRIAREREARAAELGGCDDAATSEALQQALDLRESRELALSSCRDRLAQATTVLKDNEALRLRTEQAVAPLRDLLAELRMSQQAAELSMRQFEERLQEEQVDIARLEPLLTGDLREGSLTREVARLAREIAELGAVNLAALDELAVAEERKGYLDTQNEDLCKAIDTLEDAIRRIDRETREQLQETYNFVNRHFGELFPQLFGGGQAQLVLTGEEILDAGVQIVAQPPGKKNASIHLLSGGEKALTAIALVFSMFQLNPAPFCMLDEVDAPLDDTNTGRYGALVERMSANTQFVFITHNKITMDIAKQLVGVTMQEQGVSRVVEVDIEEALRLADAAMA